MSNSRLNRIYRRMKERCSVESSDHYENYGGRGVCVCDEWKSSYKRFKAWALENGYDDALSIDRIDNDKGYSPENCRWVTQKEQCNNKRNNRYLTYNGETKTMQQWSEFLGISARTLKSRLSYGWSIQKAFETPVANKHTITAHGETKSVTEWARITGVSENTIYGRLYRGKDYTGEQMISKGKLMNYA